MYVLVSYDAVDGRSEAFRKVLSRYLVHELESVFAGDLTEGSLLKLRRDLSRISVKGDALLLVTAENRHNVGVCRLAKNPDNGALVAIAHNHHADNARVL